MIEKTESKVGSKGELFPPIHLRKKLGLSPGRKVSYSIENGRLIVELIPDLRTILQTRKPKVEVSVEELKEDRALLSQDAEK